MRVWLGYDYLNYLVPIEGLPHPMRELSQFFCGRCPRSLGNTDSKNVKKTRSCTYAKNKSQPVLDRKNSLTLQHWMYLIKLRRILDTFATLVFVEFDIVMLFRYWCKCTGLLLQHLRIMESMFLLHGFSCTVGKSPCTWCKLSCSRSKDKFIRKYMLGL